MKIEVLYPEICNLYGDLANIRYLKLCLPQAQIIKTSLQSRPAFLDEDVDLVYMGTTTENGQVLALEQLRLIREGLLQRNDGRYSARFRNRAGKRIEKYFDKKVGPYYSLPLPIKPLFPFK